MSISDHLRDELVLDIDRETVVGWIQAEVRRFVHQRVASSTLEWSMAIAVSEAATNIQKFAHRGRITLTREPYAISFVAEDDGPGFDPVEVEERIAAVPPGMILAPRDGMRGLGSGLAAIRRLMGDLRVERRTEGGARVMARRLLRGM